ncbi:MAG: FliH/SctL family protein [Rhodoferax sp.]
MHHTRNRFVPSDAIDSFAGWTFEDVDQAAVRFASKLREQELAEEKLRESGAREAGYAQGFEEGRALGLQEGLQKLDDYIAGKGQEAAQHFAQMFQTASDQIEQAQQAMAQGVLNLACEVARQVLRRELEVNPDVLRPVIREALGLLTTDGKAIAVRLHPMDLEVLQSTITQDHPGMTLTLKSDPSVSPGGCLVEAAGTVVDGTLERRWERTVARLGLESTWNVHHANG